MSRVDTSIGFPLRSEPPRISSQLKKADFDLTNYTQKRLSEQVITYRVFAFTFPVGIVLANIVRDIARGSWKGWEDLWRQVLWTPVIGTGVFGFYYLLERAKLERRMRHIRSAGYDSPVVHLTAEGQWVTFRFASGREFVDRWDRLLRFKSAPEFTEFEFPANPPIIIPTMAIPVEITRTIAQFCTIEKIPSETKR